LWLVPGEAEVGGGMPEARVRPGPPGPLTKPGLT